MCFLPSAGCSGGRLPTELVPTSQSVWSQTITVRKRPFKTESHCIQFKQLMIYQDRLGTHRKSFERREALFRRWNNHREMAATGGVGGMRDCRAWRERAPSPAACEEQNVCRLAAVVRKHLCCAILY